MQECAVGGNLLVQDDLDVHQLLVLVDFNLIVGAQLSELVKEACHLVCVALANAGNLPVFVAQGTFELLNLQESVTQWIE